MSIHRDLISQRLSVVEDEALRAGKEAEETAAFLTERAPPFPEIAVVLGSGLGDWLDGVDHEAEIPYHEIPHFPKPSVSGHGGSLVVAELGGRRIAVLRGRVHLYEGVPPEQVVFPVVALSAAGVRFLITTCAGGGLEPTLRVGDFLLLRDHIGFLPRQWSSGLGARSSDNTRWGYDREMSDHLEKTAATLGVRLLNGVLFWFSGPTYETPAEARMVRGLGGDAATMSTLPENVAAWCVGLRSAGLALITNHMMSGQSARISHTDVVEAARISGENLRRLLEETFATWDRGVR